MEDPEHISMWQIEPDELPPESLTQRDPQMADLSENAWFRLFNTVGQDLIRTRSSKWPIWLLAVITALNLLWGWLWLMTSVETFSFSTVQSIGLINLGVAACVLAVWHFPFFIFMLPLGITGPLLRARQRHADLMRELHFIEPDGQVVARAWLGWHMGCARHGKWIRGLKVMSVCCAILAAIGLIFGWLDPPWQGVLLPLSPFVFLLGMFWGITLAFDSVLLRLTARGKAWPARRESDSTAELLSDFRRILLGLLRLAWRLSVIAGVLYLAGIVADVFDLDELLDRLLGGRRMKQVLSSPGFAPVPLGAGFALGAIYAWIARRTHGANLEILAVRAAAFLDETFGEPMERAKTSRMAWIKGRISGWFGGIRARPFRFIFWRVPWGLARGCFYVWLLVWLVVNTRIDNGHTNRFLRQYENQSMSNGPRYLAAIPEAYTITKWRYRGVSVNTTQFENGSREVGVSLTECRTDFLDDLEGWLEESVNCQLSFYQLAPGRHNFQPLLSDPRMKSNLTSLLINATGTAMPPGWSAGIEFIKYQKLESLVLEALPFDTPIVLPVSLEQLSLTNCSGAHHLQRPLPSDRLELVRFNQMPLAEVTAFFAENPQPVRRLTLGHITGLDDLTLAGIPSELESIGISSNLITTLGGIERFKNLKSFGISQCSSLPNEEILKFVELEGIESLHFKDWPVLQKPGSHHPGYKPYGDPKDEILEEAEWVEKQIHWEETLQKVLEQLNESARNF